MTEKQEIRAYSLLAAALFDNFKDDKIVNETHLLYNAESIETFFKDFSGDKQIEIFTLIIASIMGKRFKNNNESNIPSYREKIKKLIEKPDIKS